MIELYFGFEGRLGRLSFFFANIGLGFMMLITVLAFLVPAALSGYNVIPTPNTAQPGLAFLSLLLGIIATFSSAAMISKRLGWKGFNGNVSWVYLLTQGANTIINAVSTAIGVQSWHTVFFSLICLGTFIIACILPGKQPGEDFDEDRLAAKVDAEMRQRYGQPASAAAPDHRARSPVMPCAPPAAPAARPASFGRR